jgi:hypothetical protein
MDLLTQAEAARRLDIRPGTLRAAVGRGTVATLTADGQTVISAWELERYRHRKDRTFALSPHLRELPAADSPLPMVLQTTLATTADLGDMPDALLRVYALPAGAAADAIVVIGDLQHWSSATIPDYRPALIRSARPQISRALDGVDNPARITWVTLGGFLSDLGDGGYTDIDILGVSVSDRGVHSQFADYGLLRLLESRLGQRVLTWPAIHPDAPDQAHQWAAASIGRLPNDIWTVDPHSGAATMTGLRHLQQAAGEDPARRAVVAMISKLVVAPTLAAASSPGPVRLPASVASRLAVQILTWRPEPEDTDLVNRLAADWPQDTTDPEVLSTAISWLRSIDRYSPAPDLPVADALEHFLEELGGSAAADNAPGAYSVDLLGVTGTTGDEWLASLTPADPVDPADNSDTTRRHRALAAYLTVRDTSASWATSYGRIMVDPAGIPVALADQCPPDLTAKLLVTRPTSYAHLTSTPKTIEAQGDAGGDLAIFLRLADGTLTLLPHTSYGQVNWGFLGSGPRDAVQDIVAAHTITHGLDTPDPDFRQAVDNVVRHEGCHRFTIDLTAGTVR